MGNTNSNDPPCVFCRKPVHTITVWLYGTQWIHDDGYFECEPRYASPDFITHELGARDE